jgi:hypothetical protein
MKWILIVLGVLVGLAALMWVIGAMLPKDHVATRMARFSQPPEKIWEALTNAEAMPSWRKDLKSVKRLPDRDGKPAWVETSSFGDMPLYVETAEPPLKLVTRIADPDLPFGGTWTFEIAPADGGATLRITERGEIRNAFFRFMSRFVFGYTSTMETYLRDLGAKFGENTTPQP